MIAIAVEEPGKLAIRQDDVLQPVGDEVLVRVRRAGICGSDIHILEGSNPFAKYPRIIGHEIAGEVEAAGPDVTGIAVGDMVVIDPVVSCGACYPCRIGRHNVCAQIAVLGVHRDGGFRTRLTLPAANVVRVSHDLDPGVAALAEPFSIAANVLSRTGCHPDDNLLIYGAGTIGLTVLQVAKLMGARCVVADLDEKRLEAASSFGADAVIHAVPGAVAKAVADETGGLGPTLVIDAAGAPALLTEAVSLVSPAGRIGLLGFSELPSAVVQKEIVGKEVSLYGSRLNRKLLPEVIGWLESGELQPAAMIRDTFAAADAEAAFSMIRENPSSTIKVQLAF